MALTHALPRFISLTRFSRHSVQVSGKWLLSLGLLSAGCYRDAAPAASKEPARASAADDLITAAGTPSPQSCAQIAAQLCVETGEASETCSSGRTIFELMSPATCAVALHEFAVTQRKLQEQHAKCEVLTETLCKGVGEATETCRMVREKTREFTGERCAALLPQSAQLIEELQQQEALNQPLSKELQAQIAASDAPSFGAANAQVTVVEFSDFECPYCARAAEVTGQLRTRYSDKIRLVFRQFPLPFHKHAQGAAEAALAAHAQGKFWEYHDKLFQNQSELGKEALADYAKQVGLNVKAFNAALDAGTLAEKVRADAKLGEQIQVQGTPTLFVNGKRVANATDVEAVSQAIEEALSAAATPPNSAVVSPK